MDRGTFYEKNNSMPIGNGNGCFFGCSSRTELSKYTIFLKLQMMSIQRFICLESPGFTALLKQIRFTSTVSIRFELAVETVLLLKYQLVNLKLFLSQNGNK
jgi:hypothetical protein